MFHQVPTAKSVLGNHEFVDGLDGVIPYLKHLDAPVVTANLIADKEPRIQGLYQPSIVVARNGCRIGIIGVITTIKDRVASTGKLVFINEVDTVRREAQKLHDAGVNIIIVLSHCGLDIDKQIALSGGPYIDIIVGGHSHSFLYNDDKFSENSVYRPEGPYPVVVKQNRRNSSALVRDLWKLKAETRLKDHHKREHSERGINIFYCILVSCTSLCTFINE